MLNKLSFDVESLNIICQYFQVSDNSKLMQEFSNYIHWVENLSSIHASISQ